MDKEKNNKVKKRRPGAGRPTTKISDKALHAAKVVLSIIAPHVPTDNMSDVSITEAVINYAKEQALILKKNVDLQKLIEANDTRAVIAKLEESLRESNPGNEE